ncbi:PLP-dependent aminotransferase family protein [Vibrio alginolyticus]|nr:PLP-dependent aminotransferase family protein [Vibrio alginolyticus]
MGRPSNKQFAYKIVYRRIHSAILEGVLKPGERVPSARALAKEMGLSRGSVEEGYALLKSEGFIEAMGQAGTRVSKNLIEQPKPSLREVTVRQPGFSSDLQSTDILPFQLGIPALDAFPFKTWARMAARNARNTEMDNLTYPSVYGLPKLRLAITQYLNLYRGVQCHPRQVFITSGYVNSIKWITKVLLSPGDKVGVEDPGYPLTKLVLENEYLTPSFLPVDSYGVSIPQDSEIKAIVVTPAHQSPTCVSLSLQRRQMLLDWANGNDRWIIEDDYDGEYRHTGLPLPALKSLDTKDRVIYSGTFSKVLFPNLRTAYIVVPQNLVSSFEQLSELYAGNVSGLTQLCILNFMQEGHFSRHIQRMRKLYRSRREFAAKIFSDYLGDEISIEPQPGGMHMILKFNDPNINDVEVANRLLANGLYSQALSQWMVKEAHPSLIVSFTNIKTEEECKKLALRLKALLK